jgi:hypothetical protein
MGGKSGRLFSTSDQYKIKENRFGFLVKYDLKNHQKFGFPKNSLILPRKAKTLYRTCSRLKSGFILSDLTHYGKKFIDSRVSGKSKNN